VGKDAGDSKRLATWPPLSLANKVYGAEDHDAGACQRPSTWRSDRLVQNTTDTSHTHCASYVVAVLRVIDSQGIPQGIIQENFSYI
jgi:hypothetical protein